MAGGAIFVVTPMTHVRNRPDRDHARETDEARASSPYPR